MDVANKEQARDSPVPREEELQITHVVTDTPAPDECQERAFKTVPEGLSIRPAAANNALGVWATKDFEKGTRFGPFCGVQVDGTTGQESSCAWEIREDNGRGAVMHWIDARDENKCNWMRYVNWEAEESEQNMKVYQEEDDIYFLTTCPIQAGSQLLSSDPRNRGREPRSREAASSNSHEQKSTLQESESSSFSDHKDKDDAGDSEGREDEPCDVEILNDDSEVDEAVLDAEPVVCTWYEDVQEWAEGFIDVDADADTDDGSWVNRKQKLPAQSGEGQLSEQHLQSQEYGELCNNGETHQQQMSKGCDKSSERMSSSLPSGSDHNTSVLELTTGANDMRDDSEEKKDSVTAGEEPFREDSELLDEKEMSPNITDEEEKMTTENTAYASTCHGNLFEKFAPVVDGNLPPKQLERGNLFPETKSDIAEMYGGNETGLPEYIADEKDISLQSASCVTPDESHFKDDTDSDQHVMPVTHMPPQEDATVDGNACESGIDSDIDVVGIEEDNNQSVRKMDDRSSPVLDKCNIDDGMSQQVWRQLICNICRKACHNKQAFEEHQKTHISQCKICHISFVDEESLAQHMRDHKERPFVCGTCGKSYKSQFSLKEHEYSHTGHRPFVCPFCPKGFMRNKKMKLHIKKAHQKLLRAARKPPPPPIMPMHESGLKIAKEIDSNTANSHSCLNFTAQDKIALENHQCSTTPEGSGSDEQLQDQLESEPMQFKCNVCQKNYPTQKSLEKHAKIHQIWGSAASLQANSTCSSPQSSDVAEKTGNDTGPLCEQSMIGPRPYKCQLCESTFLEDSHLQVHVEIHSMDGPWICVVCNRSLKQRAHLLEHVYTHWGYKPYICLYCPMDFKRTYEAERHMSLHKQQERRKKAQQGKVVKTCERQAKDQALKQLTTNQVVTEKLAVTKRQPSKDEDTSSSTNEGDADLRETVPEAVGMTPQKLDGKARPFSCEMCDKAFTAKSSLKEHLFLHYGKPYACDFCERQFTRKAYLISHMKESHPAEDTTAVEESILDAKYEEVINKVMEKLPSVDLKVERERVEITSASSDRPYSCKVCSKDFQFSATLKNHMKVHVKLKPLLCDFCERRFVRQSYLDEHIRTQHPPGTRSKDPNKPFKCDTCQLAFSKRAYLKDHKIRHKLKKPFPCTFCSKSFRRRCLLQMHISRHHAEEYLKMTTKSSEISVRSQLAKSTDNTLKIKMPFVKQRLASSKSSFKKDPLMCHECGATFSCRANVRRHMRIHSGERPFKCEFCPWTFNRKEVLQGHLKKKHSSMMQQGNFSDHAVNQNSFAMKVHNQVASKKCKSAFSRQVDLVKHQKFAHGMLTDANRKSPSSSVIKIKTEPGRSSSGSVPSDLHVCHRCGSRFETFWGLESHMRVHEKHSRFPRPFKCKTCGAAFKGHSNHTRHQRVHTPEYAAETKRLLALMDGKKSRVNASLKAEIEPIMKGPDPKGVIDPERPHVCSKCGTAYKYARNLRKHQSRHVKSKDRPFQCDICGIYGKSKISISKHKVIHNLQAPSSWTANAKGGAAYQTKQKLLSHMASHVNPSQPIHKCRHCGGIFKQKNALVIHERSHANLDLGLVNVKMSETPKDKPKKKYVISGFKCPVCRKNFTKRSSMSNHKRVHPGVEFIWEEDLKTSHTTPSGPPFECHVCHISFSKKSSLSNHLHTHRSEITDIENSQGTEHETQDQYEEGSEDTVHSAAQDRPYACDICPCTFKTRASLTTHTKVHSQDGLEGRTHVCNICECRFISSTNLKKHQRIHFDQSQTMSVAHSDPVKAYSQLENAESIDVKTKRPFRCRVCGETFKAKHLLDDHIQVHTISPRQLQVTAKHRVMSAAEIPDPRWLTGNRDTLTRMIDRPHPCPICGDRFRLKSTKYKHLRLHRQSEGKPFRCDTCGLGFYSVGNMTKHVRRVHGRLYDDVEQASSTTPDSYHSATYAEMQLKRQNLPKKKPFECPYCGDRFTMRCNMNRHRKRHETGDNLPYRCSQCGFGFKSTKERTKHMMRTHDRVPTKTNLTSKIQFIVTSSGVRRYKCPLCGDLFSESSGMYKHLRVHARSANKPYKCDVCHIGYNTVVGLSRHQGRVSHYGQSTKPAATQGMGHQVSQQTKKPGQNQVTLMQPTTRRGEHKCRYCPQAYKDRSSLWRHERIHKLGPSVTRPFPCKLCGLSCYTKSHLERHMQLHRRAPGLLHADLQGKKKCDRCKRCGLSFRTRSLFLVHMKRCSTTSSFLCQLCNVPFSNQIMLTKHLRQDHNALQRDVIRIGGRDIIRETGHDKKFCCDQCDARYKRPSELEKHLKRHALGLLNSSQNHSQTVIKTDPSELNNDGNAVSSDRDERSNSSLSHSPVPSISAIRKSLSPGRKPVHNRTAKSNKARPYVCQTCGFAFMTVIHLRKHTRLHKVALTKPFVCKICTLGYNRLLDYHRHCNVVHPWRKGYPNEIRCPRCKEKFESKTNLVEHLEKQTCEFVDDAAESETQSETVPSDKAAATLEENSNGSGKQDSERRDLSCPICNCRFQAKTHVETHMKVHDNWENQPFRCARCKLGYSTKQHLSKHVNMNILCLRLSQQQDRDSKDSGVEKEEQSKGISSSHAIVPKRHFCHLCKKGFSKKGQLRFHLELHKPSPSRPYVCVKCGLGYKTVSNYAKHMKWEHSKPKGEQSKLTAAIFMCRDCGYSVTKKSLLLEHTRNGCPNKKANPDAEAPKACPVCGNYFSSSSMLCIHLHGHVYDKLLKCSQCPLRFSLRDELERHERDHPDYNQMLLKLISTEFTQKLSDQGENRAEPVQVKIEPGLEKSVGPETSDNSTGVRMDIDHMATKIKPEPVDQPEYSYSLGSLKDSSLGDYQALLPDISENTLPGISENALPDLHSSGDVQRHSTSVSSASRLEKIVSNLAAQRPSSDGKKRPCVENKMTPSADIPPSQQTEILPEAASVPHQDETDDLSIPTAATLSLQVQESVTKPCSPNLLEKEMPLKKDDIHLKQEQQEQQEMIQRKLFRCRYCPSAFRLKGLCMAHERTVHRKVYSRRSSECQSKPVKDLSKMSVCKICNAVFEQQSSLSRHMLFKHGITMKTKPISSTSTTPSEQLSGEKIQPPIAPEIQSGVPSSHLSDDFGSSGLFITNVTSHANEQTVAPSESRPSLLKQRLESPSIFSDPTVSSMQGEVIQEVIQEPQPNPTYRHVSRLESLLTGEQTTYIPPEEGFPSVDHRPYRCEHCNFAFTQRHHLVRHIRRKSCAFHVLGRKAAAELKNKGRKTAKSRNSNIGKIKMADKKHQCNVCSQTFWKKARLESHMAVHELSKVFECQFCSEQFTLEAECKDHETVCAFRGDAMSDLPDIDEDGVDLGEEDVNFGSDLELDHAQQEAFAEEPEQDYRFGRDVEGNALHTRQEENALGVRIKQEPFD
ncbi:uncharacterized protein [Diadema antillarum]|uniref:uncharacterized protein isoform X2 n=1 Tax=Diadema antillarum TaxID=105358 RepID=UPI003A8650A9